MNNGMYSSNKDNWETPQDLFNDINTEFLFNLDVCASSDNAKCSTYFTKKDNGLSKRWHGNCWMNPPYGREIGKWIKKASKESERWNTIVVGLLPARTDTKWFHEYIYNKAEIRFLKGRLKFSNSKNSAPFPSMIVIFRNEEVEE